MEPFKVDHESRVGLSILRIHGDVDMATAPAFKSAIEATDRLIVDLTHCGYIDSSGLAVLIAKSKALGVPVTVITPGGSFFRKLLHIAGIESLFVLFATVEDAIAAEEPSTPAQFRNTS
jgi:anti-sigma B factor antagonist